MAKAKLGFTVQLINDNLVGDSTFPKELIAHHQAILEFFAVIEEAADTRMKSSQFTRIYPSLID